MEAEYAILIGMLTFFVNTNYSSMLYFLKVHQDVFSAFNIVGR